MPPDPNPFEQVTLGIKILTCCALILTGLLWSQAEAGGFASLFSSGQRTQLTVQADVFTLGPARVYAGAQGEFRYEGAVDGELYGALELQGVAGENSITSLEAVLDEALQLELGVRVGVFW